MNDNSIGNQELNALKATFARLDPLGLVIASGLVGGLVLLVATLILFYVAPAADGSVGGHLGLLAHFLPGYDVSPAGSLIGFAYGFLIAGLIGFVVAGIWNIAHHIYVFSIAARSVFERSMD